MAEAGDPRSEVFTTAAWDGKNHLLAANLHFARLRRHAQRLGIALPENLEALVFARLTELQVPNNSGEETGSGEESESGENRGIVGAEQAPYLVRIGISSDSKITLEMRENQAWPETLRAISMSAPRWSGKVRGTKHGDWEPYSEAREAAKEFGADISLLFDDEVLVDGDRCMPIILDHDGVAFHPSHAEGALDSITLEQIREGVESAGIPIRAARITIPMILRAREMIVLGSGMGVQALSEIDGRTIGSPRSRLFEAARSVWIDRLQTAWQGIDDLE